MSDWIRVEEEELETLNPAHTEESGQGVEVHVFMSPHDVPDAVRGRYDHDQNRFVIEFRYIATDEPTEKETVDERVSVRVGKRSGRLYAILVDVESIRADSVRLNVHAPNITRKVSQAVKSFAERSPWRKRQDNYRVAEQLIERKGSDLFGSLATAG